MASASVVDSLDPVADGTLGGCLGRPAGNGRRTRLSVSPRMILAGRCPNTPLCGPLSGPGCAHGRSVRAVRRCTGSRGRHARSPARRARRASPRPSPRRPGPDRCAGSHRAPSRSPAVSSHRARAQIQPALASAQIGDIAGPHAVEHPGIKTAPHQVFGGTAVSRSITVVAGANRRGLIPARPWRRSEAATVLRDTRSPSARRSARRRGAPYTPSDAAWNLATLVSSAARRRGGRGGSTVTGCAPGVEPRAWDLQQLAHPLDRVVGLLRLDHPVGFYRLCSETKKAAAFFKNSRSKRNSAFSRRRRSNSARSSASSTAPVSPAIGLGVGGAPSAPAVVHQHRSRPRHEPPAGRSQSPGGQPAPETPA